MGLWRELLECSKCGHVLGESSDDDSEEGLESEEEEGLDPEGSLADNEELEDQKSNGLKDFKEKPGSTLIPSSQVSRSHLKRSAQVPLYRKGWDLKSKRVKLS